MENLEWVGGHPALDFVNTVHAWDGHEPGREYLHDFNDLVRWHQMADLIGPRGTRALTAGNTRAEAAALREAIHLRAALHGVFAAVARNEPLPQAALDTLNETIRKTAAWRRLTADKGQVACGWNFSGAPPAAILGPVAWRAAELLEHGALDRIKECPFDEGCGWLFLDHSKNRSRTWCSMKTCGNLAKARRFRERRA